MIKVKNQDPRLEKELILLRTKNKELHDMLLDANEWLLNNHSIMDLTVTHIFRTQQEQDNFYKNNPKYQVKPFISPHQLWHGVDLSTRTFGPIIINGLLEYLNAKYNKLNYYKVTVIYHEVDSFGLHFHLQFIKR